MISVSIVSFILYFPFSPHYRNIATISVNFIINFSTLFSLCLTSISCRSHLLPGVMNGRSAMAQSGWFDAIQAAQAGGFHSIGLGPVERLGEAELVLPSLEGVHLPQLLAALG
jgi:hypothetical protein